MNLILFAIIHIVMGCAWIHTYGKLPKAIAAFAFVFLTMSFLYWGAVIINFAN